MSTDFPYTKKKKKIIRVMYRDSRIFPSLPLCHNNFGNISTALAALDSQIFCILSPLLLEIQVSAHIHNNNKLVGIPPVAAGIVKQR